MATPSLLVAGELSTRPDVDVLVPGGRIRGGDLACTGSRAVEVFSGLYADTAFLGSGRIDGSAGLTDFHFEEIATKREILTRSALCYVLADGSKQGRVAPHRVCAFDECTGLITDTAPDPSLASAVEQSGGVVITPDPRALRPRPPPTTPRPPPPPSRTRTGPRPAGPDPTVPARPSP